MLVKSLWSEKSSDFLIKLRALVPLTLEVKFNQNRTSFLTLLERRWNYARVSIHECFLEAPTPVLLALATFIMGNRGVRKAQTVLRQFIQKQSAQLNHAPKKLEPIGKVYDLNPLYHSINQEYFEGRLNLNLTWFGKVGKKPRRKVTFGLYQDSLRLVKIHSMLDDISIPDYFLSFVLYHEMLHAVVPGYHDETGHFRVHGPEFKRREKEFLFYKEAKVWEKENKNMFFGYGRSQ
jgi:hypothetical protein